MKSGLFNSIIVALALLLAVQAVVVSYMLLYRAHDIEEELMVAALRRSVDFIRVRETEMRVKVRGYAAWTEMEQFLVKPEKAFLDEFSPSSENVNLLFAYSDLTKQVYGKSYDFHTNKTEPITEAVYGPIVSNNALQRFKASNESLGGVLLTQKGPLMIMAQQVVHSDGSGPKKGTMFLGRYIDTAFTNEVSNIVRRKVVIWRTNDPKIPAEGRHSIVSFAEQKLCVVQPWFSDVMLGYAFIPCVDKRDEGIVVEVFIDRDIWNLAKTTSLGIAAFSALIGLMGVWVVRMICRMVDEAEQRFERLAHDVPMGYWLLDSTAVIRDVNPAYCRMVDMKPEQIINRHASEFIAAIGRGTFQEWLTETALRGTGHVAMRHRLAKGALQVAATGRHLPEQEGRFLLLFTDLSEQERMSAALRVSTARFSGLLGTMADPMIIANAAGSILEFNPAAERVFDLKRSDVLGHDFISQLFGKDVQEAVVTAFRKTSGAGEESNAMMCFETTAQRSDGSEFPCEAELNRLSLESEVVYTACLRDISKRKADAAEIRRLNDEQERRVEERTAQLKKANEELEGEIEERRRATDALRRSEERLQFALESTEDALWDWDVPGRRFYFSARWFRMLGYEPGELPATQDTWKQVCHPDDWVALQRRIEDHFSQRSPSFEHEHRLRTKAGVWRWIQCRGRVMKRDPLGQPLRVVGTNLDVTRRREADQKLRDSERKYRILLGNINAGVVLFNEAGIFDVNDQWQRRCGKPLNELLGKPLWNVAPPAQPNGEISRELLTRQMNQTRNSGSMRFEWTELGPAGRELICEMHLSVVELDGQNLFHGVSLDITQRKKDEAVIRESEHRFNVIARHTGLLVYDYAIDEGRIIWAGSFVKVTGWREKEFQDMTPDRWLKLIHPEDVESVVQMREKSSRTGAPFVALYRMQQRAGHYNLVEDHGIVLRQDASGQGRILGFIKVLPGMSVGGGDR
ncbi:MAG: PAS domain S-box protein [Candidatus Methylacidiphilales bacterium]|nr:PAS domain S-box protein [Candidatus Methylacidiphilales bacterium]